MGVSLETHRLLVIRDALAVLNHKPLPPEITALLRSDFESVVNASAFGVPAVVYKAADEVLALPDEEKESAA